MQALADRNLTRFSRGFVDELVCLGATPAVWEQLTGELRLATVSSLVVPPHVQPSPLAAFLSSPVLRSLRRLELGATGWRALRDVPLPQLGKAVVSSWGVFQGELRGLDQVPAFTAAPAVGLASTEFINPRVAQEVVHAVSTQAGALAHARELALLCRYGVIEGAAAWLIAAAGARREQLAAIERWAVELSEVRFVLSLDEAGALRHLTIDLSLPERYAGEREATDAVSFFERRLATAGGVLVLLKAAGLTQVRVVLQPGTRLREGERNALRLAARRSGAHISLEQEGEAALALGDHL